MDFSGPEKCDVAQGQADGECIDMLLSSADVEVLFTGFLRHVTKGFSIAKCLDFIFFN
jgi:hypothetical protein